MKIVDSALKLKKSNYVPVRFFINDYCWISMFIAENKPNIINSISTIAPHRDKDKNKGQIGNMIKNPKDQQKSWCWSDKFAGSCLNQIDSYYGSKRVSDRKTKI